MVDISILDLRVPQPGRYVDYGVPQSIARTADFMLNARNTCADAEVEIIDAGLIRLLTPWIGE